MAIGSATSRAEFAALIERHRIRLTQYADSGLLTATERANVEALLTPDASGTLDIVPDGSSAARLRERTMRLGRLAVFDTGPARGGDFESNHSHGAWAEDLLVAAEPARIVPFGPSDGVKPGDPDYERKRLSYREIAVLDGKRPDLLLVAPGSLQVAPEIMGWRDRPLWRRDRGALRHVICAIEVKSSLHHYGRRRAAGKSGLSATIKDEELKPLQKWQEKFGLPVVVLQSFVDEMHVVALDVFVAAVANGRARRRVEEETGKPTWMYPLQLGSALCAELEVARSSFTIDALGKVLKPAVWPPASIRINLAEVEAAARAGVRQ